MSEKDHTVRAKWQEAEAVASEERVAAIEEWLSHTADLLLMFEEDENAAKELRSVSGIVRMRRDDFAQRAAKVRAMIYDRDGSPG